MRAMELDTADWSGEGAFTQVLVDALTVLPGIAFVKVADAPASRSDTSFSFISNEVFVAFAASRGAAMTISSPSSLLEAIDGVGAPDYSDEGMLQYLRTERIIPPYQTRGYKLIELVRIYQAGSRPSGPR
jgi:hypothetical protein